jgi:hypothetical protein
MVEARKAIEPVCPMRRKLHFDKLSEVLEDIRTMHACDHRSAGNWTLAQVCKHLADTIHGSIDGLLLKGHRLRRVLLGRRILAWTLKHGIPQGVTLDPKLNPPTDCDFDISFVELERAMERYRAYRGRLRPHPVFGRLSRKDWDRLHCFHCAHHLSFIVPDEKT